MKTSHEVAGPDPHKVAELLKNLGRTEEICEEREARGEGHALLEGCVLLLLLPDTREDAGV